MQYIELSIETPEEEIEKRCDELTELGICGFVIENENDLNDFLENNRQYWDYVDESLQKSYAGLSRIKCYLTDDAEGQAILAAVKARAYSFSTAIIQESDWENSWKDYYEPLPIGDKLIVVPEWMESGDDVRLPVRLDPGLMFGTGSHPTTRMCLEALDKTELKGKRVLDLGCGSGILGIGALILGADNCVGADIDPKAPDVVMENAALNGIGGDKIKIFAGDVIGDSSLRRNLGGGYDVVLANIVSDVIIALSPLVKGFMAEGGLFIASGIIDGRQDEVCSAIESAGFEITEHLHEEEWHCFVCR